MKHLHKRIIGISSYAILGIAVIALSVILVLTSNSNTKTIDELNSKNEQLQEELTQTKTKRDSLSSQLESTKAALETQKKLTSKYQSEVASLKNKLISSDPNNVTYAYSFNSVEALMTAIKKNPTEYNNKQVKVVGTVIKTDHEGASYIVDDDGYDFSSITSNYDVQYSVWKKTQKEQGSIISVVITDDIQYTVVESGDYVKMYGTVKISNGEIYLANCEYSMIATRNERQ